MITTNDNSSNVLHTVRQRWQLVGGIYIALIAALAVLVQLEVDQALPILQVGLLLGVIFATLLILTSPTVRQGRYWYGVDWWLAVISGLGLVFFAIVAIIPEVLAPFDYNVEAGPNLLAPGEQKGIYFLITRTGDGYTGFGDIGVDPETGNPVSASDAPSIMVMDARSGRIADLERQNQPGIFEINRDPVHDELTPQETLNILATFDTSVAPPLVAVLGRADQFETLLENFPSLDVVQRIDVEAEGLTLLGTNRLGEDVLSRLIYGTRTTLFMGLMAALLSSVFGIPLGLLSGYLGGGFDRIATLVMDSLYSFPGLILAIALAAVRGPGIDTIVSAIAVIYIPIYFRVVRSQTLAVKEMAYVEAARSLGANELVVISRYIFPNVLTSVVVVFTINVADAILTGAALSFLGLGLPPDGVPDWGLDLTKGLEDFPGKWWLVTFPGIAIAILTLCFSTLGESLSEILNPRTSRT